MRNRLLVGAIAAAFAIFILRLETAPAQAIPLFAQRYRLSCETCHSVMPVLNAFGNAFRARGYRLPLPRHGTTGVAIRYQVEYEKTPAAGSRRWTEGGVLLSNADMGVISAFVHYSLGAQGGPGGLYLGFLTRYDAHTRTLYRVGLFELPLAQSPGQRLDDLQQYGYYGAHVGLNDLPLSSPRWGGQVEHVFGKATVADVTLSSGEFKGAPYGGKPVPTGVTTYAQDPELGLFLRTPLAANVQVGGEFLTGNRAIVPTGRNTFADAYDREGVLGIAQFGKLGLQAEQWWGTDWNSDGFGTRTGSSGGYVRLNYFFTPHSYFAVRYDAQAVPFITRDYVPYFAFMVTPHARLILQDVLPVGGGTPQFGGAVTVGFPWPSKL